MSEQPAPFAFQEAPEWQNAMTLAEQVYAKTERFPLREHVGLAASMRASAQLVASSIASANMQAAHTAAKALFTQAQSAPSLKFMIILGCFLLARGHRAARNTGKHWKRKQSAKW